MSKISAGILVYKRIGQEMSVLLLHPGGPFWAKKDSWTIPKGELNGGEAEFDAARREFNEEVGQPAPGGEPIDLGEARQLSAKTYHIWAVEGDIDISKFKCNEFEMEWPPHSGQIQSFPECDQAQWFDLNTAKSKIMAAQSVFIDRLEQKVANI